MEEGGRGGNRVKENERDLMRVEESGWVEEEWKSVRVWKRKEERRRGGWGTM